MNIYSILSSKPHNSHYLNRYIKFIEGCQVKNIGFEGYIENHHICPKAEEMFPEYISFNEHPWNKISLTARQHFIAHMLLWKAYPEYSSMRFAFWRLINGKHDIKITSRVYAKIKEEIIESISENNKERLEAGIHHCKNDVPCVNKDGQIKLIPSFIFHAQIEKKQSDKEWVATSSNEGRKRRNITTDHHAKNLIPVVNKQGKVISIVKEKFFDYKKNKDDTYAHISSKEGQRRLGKEFSRLLVCVDQNGEKIMLTSEEYDKQKTDEDSTTWLYVISISLEGKRRKNMINE